MNNYNTFVDAEAKTKPAGTQSALAQAKLKENYRMTRYRIPPNFEQSEKHRIATRVSKPIFEKPNGDKVEIDPASGLPVENEQFDHCTPAIELAEVSPAHPMYFEFVKSTIYLLSAIFLICGIFNIVTNWTGTYCQPSDQLTAAELKSSAICVLSFATRTSIANTANEESNLTTDIQDWLNLVTFFGLIIYLQWFRYSQRKTAIECDQKDWTPADFTLFVRGVPKLEGKDIDEELKVWFENNGLPDGRKLNVKRVLLCFDVREIYANEKKIKDLVHKMKVIHEKKAKGKEAEKPLLDEMKEIQEQIHALEEENLKKGYAYFKGDGANFVEDAFVTVNTQREANEVADYWAPQPLFRRLFSKQAKKPLFYGAKLSVMPAPEPSDVYWENLPIKKGEKVLRNFITLIATILVLAGVWVIIFYLSFYQDKKIDEWNQQTNVSSLKYYALAYSVAAGVQAFNYVLIYFITFTSSQEKHTTWTTRKVSQATKLAWSQFTVTALVELTIAYAMSNYWGYNGLIYNAYGIFQINAVTPAIVTLMAPLFWMGWVNMKLEKKKGERSKLTQAEADTLFEKPEFELSAKYAVVLKNMFAAAFYSPALPVALVYSIVGNFLIYWTDKHQLIRNSSTGKVLGAKLAFEMTENMEWVLVVYAVSNVVFNKLMFDTVTIPGYIVIALALVNALLPMAEINLMITPEVKELTTDDTFEKRRLEFEEDYDRVNPATRAYAMAKFEAESKGEVFNMNTPRTDLAVGRLLGLNLKL